MAEIGDKVYLKVTENKDGKLIVEGDQGFYRYHTNDEIENLAEDVNGQKVIIGTVREVSEGEAIKCSLPIACYKRSSCELL